MRVKRTFSINTAWRDKCATLTVKPRTMCQILLWWTSASKSQSINAPTVAKWTRSSQVASWNEPKPVAPLAMEELDCQSPRALFQHSAFSLGRVSYAPNPWPRSISEQHYAAETFVRGKDLQETRSAWWSAASWLISTGAHVGGQPSCDCGAPHPRSRNDCLPLPFLSLHRDLEGNDIIHGIIQYT